MNEIARPAPQSDREPLIDALRGFALIGVFLANFITTDLSPILRPESFPASVGDHLADALAEILVKGKFYSIFSFLFGLGFALQTERSAQRSANAGLIWAQRLFWLLIFGFAHLTFLWFGDILHVYALAGFTLLFFRRWSDRSLLIGGVLLSVLPYSIWRTRALLSTWIFGAESATPGDPSLSASMMEAFLRGYGEGSWREVIGVHWGWYGSLFISYVWWPIAFYALGHFFFGLVAGRRRLFRDAERHTDFFRKMLVWGMLLGGPGSLLYLLDIREKIFSSGAAYDFPGQIFLWTGVNALAAAYLAAFVLAWQTPRGRRLLEPLAAVGRMALTNYLAQSLVFLLLLSGVGAGLVGRVGALRGWALTAIVLGVQIVFSRWWLKRFRFGPAEWLWRSLTYRRLISLKKTSEETS